MLWPIVVLPEVPDMMKRCSLILVVLVTLIPVGLSSQPRSMAQDQTLDNLRHPLGTAVTTPGTLGRVRRLGTGRRTMLLLPGLGFSDDVWTEFMDRHKADATMYAVTLPGFGDTAPLPMPPAGTPFADTPWTRSALQALQALWKDEHLDRLTIVAHWALSTQIALRLAVEHPERVEAVIVVGGPLKVYYEGGPAMLAWTPAERSRFVEGMAGQWFKTVTRQTWDDNNFMSYDYAVNPRRGLSLWREAQRPSLPVWIRYLLEFYSIDVAPTLPELKVPVLVVQPGFDDPAMYVEPDRNYMRNLCLDSWRDARSLTGRLEFVTIPASRLFVMFDQPEALDRAITQFLTKHVPVVGR